VPAPGQSFAVLSFGCRINRYESQALREAWLAAGLTEAGPERAEVLLVNTCAVTGKAVSDLRQALRQAARANPAAAIVLTGCAATVAGAELAGLPGVVRVVPQAEKAGLLAPLDPIAPGGRPAAPAFAPFAVSGGDRSRPVLKIEDGCDQFCAYCVVPLARGPAVSREPGDVLAEAQRLLGAGFRELVLSGINLRAYGRGLDGRWNLWRLLAFLEERLAPEWAGRARLRLSSLDPAQLGEEALQTLAASALVCPHLHLSLQSLSPGVLSRMNRSHYGPQGIEDFLAGLARAWPLFGLGADLLTGFPGETEAEFAEGLANARRLPLTYAHVFPYSRRPGTAAAAMAGQVPEAVKTARAATLRRLVRERRGSFLRRLAAGPELTVVIENRAEPRGVCQFYVPCELAGGMERLPARSLVRVRPVGLRGATITAEALEVVA
jgi:MiaB/RimO family radical SAM methylthiotransferase